MSTSDTLPAGPAFQRRAIAGLALGALGLVFGDIGTSPLYALRECFSEAHGLLPTRGNVLGVLSLVFWAMVVVIGLKYTLLVLRVDNRGEGGTLALMTLALRSIRLAGKGTRTVVVAAGLFGTALLYGDGMIAPAISVLSAVDGLAVASPESKPLVVPLTVLVLVVFFAVQRRVTGAARSLMGPVVLLWFLAIATLGAVKIVERPDVLAALSPYHGVHFLVHHGRLGFFVLSAVFLVLTGAEALYADLGHYGRVPIRIGWFVAAFPCLVLSYFGQGALLLADPTATDHPFFRLAPRVLLYPLVVLSVAAAVIASQAIVSGAFAITRQAVQLGYLPRLTIQHTSKAHVGQIYVPLVNWGLLLGSCALVVGFATPSNLAAAYGVGMATTMVITTVLVYFVVRYKWRWNPVSVALIFGVFLLVDVTFWIANLGKIGHGGWVPLAVGLCAFALLTTWTRGRTLLAETVRGRAFPLDAFIEDVGKHPPLRVRGTAVFMTGSSEGVPAALLHNIKNNRCLHENVVLLTVTTDEVPHVPVGDRVEVATIAKGFHRVNVRYGFTDSPNIPYALELCQATGLDLSPSRASFFLGQDVVVPTEAKGMALWRKKLFAFMSRNSQQATAFFNLPPGRVVEIGGQVEL